MELVRPRLEALREAAAATSRDRLKDLEIEEFVYLPVGPQRPRIDYGDSTVLRHLAESVDEGGEARRYFLRVRIGAWDEQVVVSVLVRVHTQGGMLVLEVVPHILTPIKPEFRAVDVIAARGEDDLLRDGVRALLSGPAAASPPRSPRSGRASPASAPGWPTRGARCRTARRGRCGRWRAPCRSRCSRRWTSAAM
ncbi:hypothetical protein ACFQ2B_11655 [Streptomyces stramineus]